MVTLTKERPNSTPIGLESPDMTYANTSATEFFGSIHFRESVAVDQFAVGSQSSN